VSIVLSQIEAVEVEISVVLGRSVLPMQQLLRMGRGAVIPLDASEKDEVWIKLTRWFTDRLDRK